MELLNDGKVFYPAELEAISQATRSVHIEAFIFHPGEVGERFVTCVAEAGTRGGEGEGGYRCCLGSFPTPERFFQPLRMPAEKCSGISRWASPPSSG